MLRNQVPGNACSLVRRGPATRGVKIVRAAGLVYLVSFLATCGSLLQAEELAARSTASVPVKHAAFFADNCIKCHGSGAEEGLPRLDTIPHELTTLEAAERWQRVLAVLNSGEMPPSDAPQPSAVAKTEFLADLSAVMVKARKAFGDQGRVGVLRRLNRREYVNTIQDLLGVDALVEGLPSDAGVGTFDTAGSGLTMSSDQLEQYLAVGRDSVRTAFARLRTIAAPPERKIVRREAEVEYHQTLGRYVQDVNPKLARIRMWEEKGKNPDALPDNYENVASLEWFKNGMLRDLGYITTCLTLPRAIEGSYLIPCYYLQHYPFRHSEPMPIPKDAAPGEYRLRASIGTSDDPLKSRRFVELCSLEGGSNERDTSLDVREVTNHFRSPATIEFTVNVTPNSERHFVLREKRHSLNDYLLERYRRELTDGDGLGTLPTIWIDWLEWEGPIPPASPPPALDGMMAAASTVRDDETVARDALTRFATRAFRGVPPTPDFMAHLMDVRRRALPKATDGLESLVEPMAVILAAPGFLYLDEPASAESGADRHLTAAERAARLAYFLWAGPPDDALLAAAEASVADPQKLVAEVDRLVLDPRAKRFAEGFAGQWLRTERLDLFQFDRRNFPDFDSMVRAAAKQEVYETIYHLLRENLDARNLLDSDFVVVNDLLAAYYGLDAAGPPIRGHHFRPVRLPDDSPRGGLLGMACIHGMGSNGTATSPVERGAWILRFLLNDPPAPAPANVPQLSRLEGKKLTARERLVAHQEQPQCAQCHRRIDPLGFGLENFDAAGQWREVDTLLPSAQLKRDRKGVIQAETYPIDPAGAFHGGPAFANYFELRSLIAARGDDFLRGLVEHLYAYAIGRPVSLGDTDAIDAIVAAAKERNGGLRDIVKLVVATPEFLNK
jgi:mono/diheme cytochrome c family protein